MGPDLPLKLLMKFWVFDTHVPGYLKIVFLHDMEIMKDIIKKIFICYT